MLRATITFFVLAIIAAALGFGGLAAGIADIAQLLFYGFLLLFAVSLLSSLVRSV